MEKNTNTPNVFISYSWDNENGNDEHKKWVLRDIQ